MPRIGDLGLRGTTHVFGDADDVSAAAAKRIAELSESVAEFHVALAGGSTPKRLYTRLSRAPYDKAIEWRRWHVWFGDERAVSPTDSASNYHMANSALISHVPIRPDRVHRMHADAPDLAEGARMYSEELQVACVGMGNFPRLDLVLLGLGDDGHTASLFPGDPALGVTDRACTVSRAVVEPRDRLTLTFPAINGAAHVVFLVTGSEKGTALRNVRAGRVPASRVNPDDGALSWFLDEAAAASLVGTD